MISLGCAKNLVDAEIMLGSVLQRGMEITSRAEDADVLVVNTCAFIDSAKEESIEAILEAHQQRGLNKRPDQKLIVSGCMSQRFARELHNELPEVDAFIGLDQVSELGAIVEKIVTRPSRLRDARDASSPRRIRPVADETHALLLHRHTPHVHSRLRHTAIQTYSRAFRVHENCRGLQSSVQFLRDPPNARKASEPQTGICVGGNSCARPRRCARDQLDQSGHHVLRNGFVGGPEAGPRQPVDSTRGPTLVRCFVRFNRSKANFGSACFTRTRRIGAMN